MPWNSFKDLANKRLEQSGLNVRINEALVLEDANGIIYQYFGSEAYEKARAIFFRSGVLNLAVLSDSLLQEIESQKEEFLAILNEKLEKPLVKEIKFLG